MTKVLLLTRPGQSAGEFVQAARGAGGLFIGKNQACVPGEGNLVILEASPDALPANFGADVVLIGRGISRISTPARGAVRDGALAVFDRSTFADLDFIARNNLVPVSCGTGEKNTVTVSSMTDDSLTVSVQRALNGPGGRRIGVQEYVFSADREIRDIYMTLLGCALSLLCAAREG